ncbi:hypothetical protein CFT61_08675 [Segatella copri]|uniref:Uncharacterized protein n=1 Tax=Segatella copri TaxID=165179 RepID=A0AA91TJN0_9BACT|nr:hypothetical protein CFT61_08675 [Segatella copri]
MRVKRFLLLQFLKLLPFQGAGLLTVYPRVLPWARSFCPFRAQVCSTWSAGVSKFAPHALKGQKLTAQGIALGSFVCRTVALKGQKLSISEPYTKKGLPLVESPFLRL